MIRILLVEKTGLWRGALAAVLSYEDDLSVVAQLARIDDIVPIAETARPDVAVIDLGLPTNDRGLAAARALNTVLPGCGILVLTEPALPGALRDVLDSHVRGFLGKDATPQLLAQSVRRVAGGERVIDPHLAVAAMCGPANPLTQREKQVLRVARTGVPSREIAARLHLTVGTVRNYLSMIMRKTGGRNRMEAVRRAQEAGWL